MPCPVRISKIHDGTALSAELSAFLEETTEAQRERVTLLSVSAGKGQA